MTILNSTFSIVIPTMNSGQFIRRAIESVNYQEMNDTQIIVVDNLSDDNTQTIVSNFPNVTYIRERDRGQSDAINKGFRLSRGKIFAWLNADEFYLPGVFLKVLRAMTTANADVVYGDTIKLHEDEKLEYHYALPFAHNVIKYWSLPFYTSSTFIRKASVDESNLVREELKFHMDLELYLRLVLSGKSFQKIGVPLSVFCLHSGSKTHSGRDTPQTLRSRMSETEIIRSEAALRCRGAIESQLVIHARGFLNPFVKASQRLLSITNSSRIPPVS